MPNWLLLCLEVTFLGLVVAGVALIYPPAAFILTGAMGVVVCERSAVVAENRRRRAERSQHGASHA